MKFSMFSRYIIITFFVVLFSCKSKNNTQQNAYENLLYDLKYKSYKTMSENSLPPLLMLYNNTEHADNTLNTEVSENVLRLLLGYFWAIKDKPVYALAESNIVNDNSSKDKDLQLLANSLCAIAFYEKGWDTLVIEKWKSCEAISGKKAKVEKPLVDAITYNLIIGTLCIYQEKYQDGRYHFAQLNTITNIDWPYLIVDAMADIKDGEVKKGLKKIKSISEIKGVPETIVGDLKKGIIKNKNFSKTPDYKIFWTKSTSSALFETLFNSDIPSLKKTSELLKKLSEKLKIE